MQTIRELIEALEDAAAQHDRESALAGGDAHAGGPHDHDTRTPA